MFFLCPYVLVPAPLHSSSYSELLVSYLCPQLGWSFLREQVGFLYGSGSQPRPCPELGGLVTYVLFKMWNFSPLVKVRSSSVRAS